MGTRRERARNESRVPVRRGVGPALWALASLILAATVWTGCADQGLAPANGSEARLALATTFPENASAQAAMVDAWRVQVVRPGEGVIAEQNGTIGPDQVTVSVSVSVTLNAACESLVIHIELLRGEEIWFLAEDQRDVCVGDQTPPQVQLQWVGPLIGIDPATLSFASEEGTDPPSQTLSITNEGGGTLHWTASAGASWLGLSAMSGSLSEDESQDVVVAVSGTGLAPDAYQASITINDAEGGNDPEILPVEYTVTALPPGTVEGRVTADEEGLSGVEISYSGRESGTVTTGELGAYEIPALPVGIYEVSLTTPPEGIVFPATTQSVEVKSGTITVADFPGTVIRTSAITGTVTVEGAGASGVVVSLTGTESAQTSTGSQGGFSFTGLPAGDYEVSVSDYPGDISFTATSQAVSLGVGDSKVVGFAGSYVRTSAVSGSVSGGGEPLAGVGMRLTGGPENVDRSQLTNATGNYDFSGLRAGTYTVAIVEAPSGFAFNVTSRQVTVGVAQRVNVNFSGTALAIPSASTSYIEACPAVILPLDYEDNTTLTVGARDVLAQPLPGAEVILSGSGHFGSSVLTTGADGNASTWFSSFDLGAQALSAQITANGTTITIQESDDLYIDQYRSVTLQRFPGDDGQTVVAGQTATFRVEAFYAVGGPAASIPVGWEVEGGNCFYGFTDAEGVAGANVSVAASVKPGSYHVSAVLAGGNPLVFTYYVVASLEGSSSSLSTFSGSGAAPPAGEAGGGMSGVPSPTGRDTSGAPGDSPDDLSRPGTGRE